MRNLAVICIYSVLESVLCQTPSDTQVL